MDTIEDGVRRRTQQKRTIVDNSSIELHTQINIALKQKIVIAVTIIFLLPWIHNSISHIPTSVRTREEPFLVREIPNNSKEDSNTSIFSLKANHTKSHGAVGTHRGTSRIPVYNLNDPKPRGKGAFGMSPYLIDTTNPDNMNAVWIAKWNAFGRNPIKNPCNAILTAIRDSLTRRTTTNDEESRAATTPSSSRRIFIIDSSDYGAGSSAHKCLPKIADAVGGARNVHFASRSLVKGRDFSCLRMNGKSCSLETPFADLNGTLRDYRNNTFARHIRNGVISKYDFTIRTDLMVAMDELVTAKFENGGGRETANKTKRSVNFEDYYNYNRTRDVAHFWDIEKNDAYGQLRNRVTQSLRRLVDAKGFTGTVGLVSPRNKEGRSSVNDAYANGLLTHKIVVVCQRDGWEDHLRLMESFLSGAMVMSDSITHMPSGFVDGESVVIYQSLEDLEEKVIYYLDEDADEERIRIAKAGRKLAIEHHKPRQAYERLIIGTWPVDINDPVIKNLE